MSMQDKEIDSLFRHKLRQMEAEPVEEVWTGIANELDRRKRKGSLTLYIRAAVIAAIFIAAAFYFIPGNFWVERPAKVSIAKTGAAAGEFKPDRNVSDLKFTQPRKLTSFTDTGRLKHSTGGIVSAMDKDLIADKQENVLKENNEETITEPSPALANAAETETVKNEVFLKNEDIKVDNGEPKPAKIIYPGPEERLKMPVKKHGIRSLGDLINVVIARVDKRENKVIEFSDNDDDESTLTGLNLGIVRIKKDK